MRQIPAKDLSKILELEKKQEKQVYKETLQLLEEQYEKLWAFHKTTLPLNEMLAFLKECTNIKSGLEKAIKEDHIPFKYAIKLNEPLATARKSYLEKFTWLLASIQKEITSTEAKYNLA